MGSGAYQRGVKVAGLWKRFSGQIKYQDSRCVGWAKNHRLPTWVGHIPVVGLILAICGAAIFASLIVTGCLIFIWAIVYIIQNIGSGNSQHDDYYENKNQADSLMQEDDLVINSALNGDYDGAPYKSPAEE